jgi:hypothetical protein
MKQQNTVDASSTKRKAVNRAPRSFINRLIRKRFEATNYKYIQNIVLNHVLKKTQRKHENNIIPNTEHR